jgi:molybdopterin molybdotransferase
MTLVSVHDALSSLASLIAAPTTAETVGLMDASGRILAMPLAALRTQPPVAVSAMDGYAARAIDMIPGAQLRVIGEAAAGHAFTGKVGLGEAVRIFTGAPLPEGADTILIQENADHVGQPVIIARQSETAGRFVRATGLDFREGEVLLEAGMRLDARRIGLAAAMGHGMLRVHRQPRVGILATGDELVLPGEVTGQASVVASNSFALASLVRESGGVPVDLGIARDNMGDLKARIGAARAQGCDMLVTLGGASVGDHDLVQAALTDSGMNLQFWKIAMRPGKPLMAGQLGRMLVLGLPGNPVSSIICGLVFVQPMLKLMQGARDALNDRTQHANLGASMPANDMREDYVRAALTRDDGGHLIATPAARQDSSMLKVLAQAHALIIRPAHAPNAKIGEACRVLILGH